jgi:hypothetical protein
MVEALLADPDSEVRQRMATNGAAMSQHPSLGPLFRQVAEQDSDEMVRAKAVNGMRGFLPPAEAVAYARARLAADPTGSMAWGAFSVAEAYSSDQPCGHDLLQDLGSCEHELVASVSRSTLYLL